MSESLKEYCVRYDRLELLAQWHPEKNGDLTPEKITSGSQKKVWWRCEKGHEWIAQPYERAKRGTGCPYCAGKRILPGMDLASLYPHLVAEWHHRKNGELCPENVLPGSQRSVWWKCGRGHEWQAKISDRATKRSDCPYCTNRKVLAGFNDLKTVDPLVAAQWHPDKNAPLEPCMVLPGSTKRVWWRCTDGHEWKAVIYSRTGAQKCGCPVCAGKTPRVYK